MQQPRVTFTGIERVIEGSVTLSHGISPGSATLRIAPQPSLPQGTGTLRFELGAGVVELHACKIDHHSLERSDDGETWVISIVDRRWKWRFGQVSGRYNVPRDDAAGDDPQAAHGLVAGTERTPQQLAAWYLDALGESGYDVAALPNDARPPVDHDHDNPADALAELCEALGCRVVLGLDDRVRIVRAGVGAPLSPAFALLEDCPTVNPPEMPDRIAVVCGPSVYQVDFALEAVGLDVSRDAAGARTETLRPLNQLSYKPPGGWATIDLPYMTNIGSGASGEDVTGLRALAVKSVFRYYRIVTPVRIPGYESPHDAQGHVMSLEQILPVFEEQVQGAIENSGEAPLPAAVFGVYYPGLDDLANTQHTLTPQEASPPTAGPESALATPCYLRGFSIDAARGLVIFDEPVFKNSTPEAAKVTLAPAQLVLRTKCQVRDRVTRALVRHVRERSTGGSLDTPTRYLSRPELVVTHVPRYAADDYANFPPGGPDPRTVERVDTNLEEINQRCDEFLDAALEEYQVDAARQVRAIGICPVELDGAIAQVTYSVGAGGATTVVARNSEQSVFAAGHGERRRGELLRAAVDEARFARSPAATRRIRRAAAAERRSR